ncbi:uncharacterized protein MELLADRAFT_71897 [Melampsora larici-populina 98AG31]|uniref:Uncharacterized protein n=1 Tax=Melampsora larici-populina (strain 98AG31 / pathotype 3-4-7) TaxID=747676 RepID=F4RM10_MELLP|nr:uncharacterized protein MELLADRAFT_71897 [Melampsora larici-populina 98AG31]EGG06640.1 hypothetical protein MELLADRAFT_71897 [Melampsora larici-populina 98AG31]
MADREYGTRKFKRGYEWEWPGATGYSNAIDSSLWASPLDEPPPLSVDTKAAFALKQYKEFFKIVSPIDVNMFEFLLKDHPNQPFVKSVVRGLRHGFWPMSELPSDDISYTKNHQVIEITLQ